MFMKDKHSGDLIRIEDIDALHDPFQKKVIGCDQAGQEEQDATEYDKNDLMFPSGEELPRCWHDPSYQIGRVPHQLGS